MKKWLIFGYSWIIFCLSLILFLSFVIKDYDMLLGLIFVIILIGMVVSHCIDKKLKKLQ